jgi:outer membrane lipoprotein-sorting protein
MKGPTMKTNWHFFLLFLFSGIFLNQNKVFAQELTGRDIAVKVKEQRTSESEYAVSTMILINKRNQKRIRKVHRWSRDYQGKGGIDKKTIIFFESPADVRNTGLLIYSYTAPSADDDRWLYLPALQKVRRISSKQKGDYFMGTDFTYEDMGEQDVDEDEHTLLRTENLNGIPCFVVQSIPREKNHIYGKKVLWIDKSRFVPLKVEFYSKKGNLIKVMTSEDIEKIDGKWTAKRITMNNIEKKHKTILEIDKVEYDISIPDSKFTQTELKRGL